MSDKFDIPYLDIVTIIQESSVSDNKPIRPSLSILFLTNKIKIVFPQKILQRHINDVFQKGVKVSNSEH